jgi:hypothetical protein
MAKKQNKEQMPPATAESQNKKPPMGKPSKKASPLNSPQPTSAHKNLEAAFKTVSHALLAGLLRAGILHKTDLK